MEVERKITPTEHQGSEVYTLHFPHICLFSWLFRSVKCKPLTLIAGRYALQVVGVYLVGPMWPQKGGDMRAPGDTEPEGHAVFHGGTVSVTFEW